MLHLILVVTSDFITFDGSKPCHRTIWSLFSYRAIANVFQIVKEFRLWDFAPSSFQLSVVEQVESFGETQLTLVKLARLLQ